MAIFGYVRENSIASTGVEDIEMSEHEEALDEILAESAEEFYKINAGLYISDIMMEQSILENAADPEVLLEAFGKDVFAKIKAAFIKLKDGFIKWCKKVVEFMKALVLSGEKFVDTFGDKIRSKDASKFSFEGYPYDAEAGQKMVSDLIAKTENDLKTYYTLIDTTSGAKAPKLEDEKKKIVKDLGARTVSELFKNVELKFKGGRKEKETIKGFGKGASKDAMLKFIVSKKDLISDIEEKRSDIEDTFSNIEQVLDRAENEVNKGAVGAWTSLNTSCLKFGVAIMMNLLKTETRMIKEIARSYESTLKRFLTFHKVGGSVKESAEFDMDDADEDEPALAEDSILEAAMRYI